MPAISTLFELLRDESEIRDLLEAYGEAAPDEATTARERLITLVSDLGETPLLSALFAYASGFARMAQEVFDLCAESGVAIAGQIQVKTDDVFLRQPELNTGWAFAGRATWDAAAEERGHALASALEGVLRRLSPESVVRQVTESVETPYGRS